MTQAVLTPQKQSPTDARAFETILDALEANKTAPGSGMAFTFTNMNKDSAKEKVLTADQLHSAVMALAKRLAGIAQPGDRVLVAPKPGLSFVVSMLACFRSGAIAVPAYAPTNARLKKAAAFIAKDCAPVALLTDFDLDPAEIGIPQRVDVSDCTEPTTQDDYLDGLPGKIAADDLAYLQYTSGSTSQPKGVKISHANIIANTTSLAKFCSFSDGDRIFSWLPLYHDMGLIGGVFQPIFSNVDVWLSSPYHFARSPSRWMSFAAEMGITHTGGPNSAFKNTLLDAEGKSDVFQDTSLAKLAVVFNGSEPVSLEVCSAFADHFSKFGLRQGAISPCYGLAENTLFASAQRFKKKDDLNTVGCGKAEFGTDFIIVDPTTGRPLADQGDIGEIVISGPSVAGGYWNDPIGSSSEFVLVNKYPAVRTGDLGFMSQGELHICGRIKDTIIVGGRNLYPADIEEEILTAMPKDLGKFTAVCVEAPTGCISVALELPRRLGDTFDAAQIRSEIADVVYKETGVFPRQVVLAPPSSLARATNGKIQRGRCRALIEKGLIEDAFGSVLKASGQSLTKNRGSSERANSVIAWLNNYADRAFNSLQMRERRTIPAHIILEFGRKGLFGLQVDPAQGGLGLSVTDTLRVQQALASLDPTLAAFVGVHNALAVAPILKSPKSEKTSAILEELASGRAIGAFALTEETSGSYPTTIQTTARKVNGGFLLTGKKRWIGNAAWARYIVVIAQCVVDDRARLTAMIVDTETQGVRMGAEALTMGVSAMIQNDVLFDDVFVADDMVLDGVGEGFRIAQDTMRFGRLGIAAIALGAMQKSADLGRRFAKNRTVGDRLLASLPHTESLLIDVAMGIEFLSAGMREMANAADLGGVSDEALSAIKIVSSEISWTTVDRMMQLLGARGYVENNLMPQLMADVRLLRIFEGTTQRLGDFLGQRVNGGAFSQCHSAEIQSFTTLPQGMSDNRPNHDPDCMEQGLSHAVDTVLGFAERGADADSAQRLTSYAKIAKERLCASVRQQHELSQLPGSADLLGDSLSDMHDQSYRHAFPETDIDPLVVAPSPETGAPQPANVDRQLEASNTLSPATKYSTGSEHFPQVQAQLEEWLKKMTGEVPPLDKELSSLGLDSLHFMTLIHEVDAEYGVDISEDDIASLKTFNDLCHLIGNLKTQKNGGDCD